MRVGSRRSLGLPAIFLVSIAALAAWTAVLFWTEYSTVRQDAERNAMNLASALGEHTTLTLRVVDQALAGLSREIQPDSLEGSPERDAVNARLAELQRELPQILALYLLSAEGRTLASSLGPAAHTSELGDRTRISAHRSDPGSELQIARPAMGRAGSSEERRIVYVSRGIYPEGELEAVVAAALSLDIFHALFTATDLGQHGVLTLFRDDGTLIARSPFQEDLLGADFSGSPLFSEHLPEADSGTYVWRDPSDGESRIMAYRRVEDLPLVVQTGLGESDVFSAWRQRAYASGAALLLLFTVTAVFGARGVATEARRLKDAHARSRHLETLALASARLARAKDIDELFRLVVELAREVVPCHQAAVSLTEGPGFRQAANRVSLSEAYHAYRSFDEPRDGSGIYRLVCESNQPMRLRQEELEQHPAWRGFGPVADRHPPLRGWLAVPLIGEEERNLGLIQLSDRKGGEFTADDEAIMVQLASLISVAVENIRAAEAQQAAQQAAEAVAAEKERILASLTDGFYVLDSDWRYLYMNEQAKRILKCEDLIGKRIWDVYPGLRETPMWSEYHRAVRDGVAVAFQMFSKRLQVWLEIRAYPFEGQLTVVFQDITARVETEAQLRQAQKMEAVGQLTGGVAHDFNNLLTVILGNAEVLVEASHDNPSLHRAANLTMSAGQRAAELTRRLLAFARRQPLAPRPVEVGALLQDIEPLLRSTIGEDVDLRIVVNTGDWLAFVDSAQLQSAIVNLAINARDAMPSGGRLTLEAGRATVEPDVQEDAEGVSSGEYVVIAVTDSGKGMSEEVRQRAFEPFFTTKPPSRGSGLGLSMVYGFIKQSQGKVTIYSEPDEGTTVKLYLPRWVDQLAASDAPADTDSTEAPQGRACVLVVEDDAMVRAFVQAALADSGYRVLVAEDGVQALGCLEKDGSIELLLTDVILPGGMNGRQLADAALQMRPDLQVLFMSGYTENAIVHHGRLDPGVNLLQKPFRRLDLVRRVHELLSRQQVASSSSA